MTTGDSHKGSDSQHRLSDQISANTNYLKGRDGDRSNAVLAAAGYNVGREELLSSGF